VELFKEFIGFKLLEVSAYKLRLFISL